MIKRKIDVFVWLSLAFVVVLISLIADNLSDSVYDEIEAEYATYQSVLAESSAKTLRMFFEEVETELRLLSKILSAQNLDKERAIDEIEGIINSHEEVISTIILLDYAGRVLVDPVFGEHSPELLEQLQTLFKTMILKRSDPAWQERSEDETIISDGLVIDGQFAGFAVASPLLRPTKEGSYFLSGMIVALISKAQLENNLLESIGFKKGSAAFIVTHTLVGLASQKSRQEVLGFIRHLGTYPEGEELIKMMMNGEEKTLWRKMQKTAGGKVISYPVLVSFSPASFSDVIWSVAIMTPKNEITKLVQESRFKSLMLASFVATILYIGAIILMRLNHVRVAAQEKAKYATELAEKNMELEKLNKIKDEFVSIVSHDMRSPVGLISSYAKILISEAEKKGTETKHLQTIINSSNRLLTLINDILDLAKVEAGEMRLHLAEVDMDNLITELVRTMKLSADEKGIELIYEPDENPKTVIADNSKLYQILNNLTVNAIKFTPPNGKIKIRKTAVENSMLISVIDNGPGFTEEEKERIFEKFKPGKQINNKEGTGLGLAICKNLVELHNGKIWVVSPVSNMGNSAGSEFNFTIPLLTLPQQ
ncbi:MAG: HAMP domain-containing histidine kinase [Nitrospinota bacterium]|nr:HAMP domain-containing histidine kinase [Nitrospinota bacterium]